MFHNKTTTYEPMEKKPKEKKFKQNAYEEIRKLVDDASSEARVLRVDEGNNIVKEVKKKGKNQENIKFKFNLFG